MVGQQFGNRSRVPNDANWCRVVAILVIVPLLEFLFEWNQTRQRFLSNIVSNFLLYSKLEVEIGCLNVNGL